MFSCSLFHHTVTKSQCDNKRQLVWALASGLDLPHLFRNAIFHWPKRNGGFLQSVVYLFCLFLSKCTLCCWENLILQKGCLTCTCLELEQNNTETNVYRNVSSHISLIWKTCKRMESREIPEIKSTQMILFPFFIYINSVNMYDFVYHLGIFIWQRFIFKYEIKMINYSQIFCMGCSLNAEKLPLFPL